VKLIVGLGNPGQGYETTRHNLGFLVVDALADESRWKWRRSRLCGGWVAEGTVGAETCLLLKPATFMNHSGSAVRACVQKKGIARKNLLVVCDDFHLDFGRMRIRATGSDGGHNGLSSIIDALTTKDFGRLRIGIGPVPAAVDAADFVLAPFKAGERKKLTRLVAQAASCCEAWITDNMSQVMNMFNKKEQEHE